MRLQTQESRLNIRPPPRSSANPLVKNGNFALICKRQRVWERGNEAPDPGEQDRTVHHHLVVQPTLLLKKGYFALICMNNGGGREKMGLQT